MYALKKHHLTTVSVNLLDKEKENNKTATRVNEDESH